MSGLVTKQQTIEISKILAKSQLPTSNSNSSNNSSTMTKSNDIIVPRPASSSSSSQQTSWLLRFFESKHFDMSIAISYLFNTKEPGVQTYLCNRLFSFSNRDVDFYLPQLLNIYIYCCNDNNEQLIADMLNTYFRSRCSCRTSGIDFSLRCSWLLDAHINDNAKLAVSNTKESRIRRGLNNAIKLYKLIISERLRPSACKGLNNDEQILEKENELKEEEPQQLHENKLQPELKKENNTDCESKSVDDLDVSSDEATNSASSQNEKLVILKF